MIGYSSTFSWYHVSHDYVRWQFIIPSNLETITVTNYLESNSFNNVNTAKEVILRGNISSIPSYALYNNKSIEKVILGDTIVSIEECAFNECSSLTSLEFENPEGWQIYSRSSATSGTSISASDLSNAATAAEYLEST